MDEKNVDKEIKISLLKNTDDVIRKKEEIWNNVEIKLALNEEKTNINLTKIKETNMSYKPRGSKRSTKKSMMPKSWLTATIAAALLIGIFTASTDTGQAFVNNIKEYFAPQKQVIDEIEGMPEEKEVVLKEGEAGYIIYIDEERYNMIGEDGIDKIVPNQKLDDKYPEVSMTITQVEDKTPEQLAEEITNELQSSFRAVKEIEKIIDPVEGLLVSAIDGDEWNSKVTQVYIVSNGKAGSFVIQQKYFLEAAEGHGARFYNMLKEFKVVEKSINN